MNLEEIKKILEEHKDSPILFKRNLLKEYLQILGLSFIYSQKEYQPLIFYGGSCLRHCFDLPRLSEDLDFVDLNKKINLEKLAKDLSLFFGKFLVKPKIKIQKFRIYLKFPVLYHLKLARKPESEFVILKIEVFKEFDFCKNYKIEIVPVFKFNCSFLVRTLDLSSLMATKIRAILLRKWEKKDKKGRVLAKVKGRDYFDLMWYLEKGIKPNLKCLGKKMSLKELKETILKEIERVDRKSLIYDLEGLIEDKNFIKDLAKNLKKILIKGIKEKLEEEKLP